MDKSLILGVTGGIAAYKALILTRQFVAAGIDVQVVMTEAATRFIAPLSFETLSGHPVLGDLWQPGMPHIHASRKAQAILIAPATADFLAKAAQGHADDLLSTLALARDCPLLVAPAMNRKMWENPATQRNIATLDADGVSILGPGCGMQACGEEGDGRMLEPEALCAAMQAFFTPKELSGRRVLLTAGPTFEALDPVRGLTNRSSGQMGFALAQAAADAGADVTLIAGPVAQPTPWGVKRVDVVSARQMHEAVFARIERADVFIAVAAVADYRPAETSAEKLKKDQGGLESLLLAPNPDILAEVAALEKPPFCVGFAAESQRLAEYAEAKRRKKNIPLIVGNLLADGLGKVDNRIVLFDAEGCHPLPPASKADLSRHIVAHLARLLETAHELVR
ncbi:MAG: bifunctional phosphopantothenoylcysteine decarboxylase/phosphopantothenate--cysteine ligase CoaBC [Zoogloeaceae bacterium]|jgi:phosphopantothenoylcysteine decarboxylase/phosphopantothenate--cysteine ligase|nr:bifunctional phosphopantothenoylcysteine decarboxylase/phosphopantothenate--cysteine ligase CoaBC [Zoogloeaceae bacterium]